MDRDTLGFWATIIGTALGFISLGLTVYLGKDTLKEAIKDFKETYPKTSSASLLDSVAVAIGGAIYEAIGGAVLWMIIGGFFWVLALPEYENGLFGTIVVWVYSIIVGMIIGALFGIINGGISGAIGGAIFVKIYGINGVNRRFDGIIVGVIGGAVYGAICAIVIILTSTLVNEKLSTSLSESIFIGAVLIIATMIIFAITGAIFGAFCIFIGEQLAGVFVKPLPSLTNVPNLKNTKPKIVFPKTSLPDWVTRGINEAVAWAFILAILGTISEGALGGIIGAIFGVILGGLNGISRNVIKYVNRRFMLGLFMGAIYGGISRLINGMTNNEIIIGVILGAMLGAIFFRFFKPTISKIRDWTKIAIVGVITEYKYKNVYIKGFIGATIGMIVGTGSGVITWAILAVTASGISGMNIGTIYNIDMIYYGVCGAIIFAIFGAIFGARVDTSKKKI